MIRHIVLFKYNDGLTQADPEVAATRQALTDLGPTLPIVRGWEVRQCFGDQAVSHDLILLAQFDTKADLAAYAVDPEHQKVIVQLDRIADRKAVADFEV